jgi:membrane protease subunit (stomatin/prohibitin family)
VVIVAAAFPGGTPAVLQQVIASQAKAQNVTSVPVSGLGEAAYAFTLHDAASNSSGVATTVLGILYGGENIDITAEATPAQIEVLARDMIGS